MSLDAWALDPDVRDLIGKMADGVANVLGHNLVGLYLTGSLTYGDFHRGSSDIDYLAVLHVPIDIPQRQGLVDLHDALGIEFPTWRERIEGSYVTADLLPSISPPAAPRPYINQGAFWDPDPAYGREWLINRYALQESGMALRGPSFNTLVEPVSMAEVRAASAADLFEEWLPQINDPEFLPNSHLEAYVTLTMCRIFHRQFNAGVVSKRVAATWVRSRVEPAWRDLIDAALAWEHGQTLGRRDEVRTFIAHVGQVLRDPGAVWTER